MSTSHSGKPLWAQQIVAVRKRLGLSQTDLAVRLSTSQSNVAKWEAGTYRPSPKQFMALSQFVPNDVESLAFMQEAGVPTTYLDGRSPKGLVPSAMAEAAVRKAKSERLSEIAAAGLLTEMEASLRHIPLLKDAAAAGTPRMVDEKELERLVPFPREWLPVGGSLYMLHITGDSMDPVLLDNHIVIVDVDQRDPKRLVNDMVIARDGDGVTVKWLREDEGEFLLVPNHVSVRHPVRRLRKGKDMAIVGKVIKWIGEPPPPPKKR